MVARSSLQAAGVGSAVAAGTRTPRWAAQFAACIQDWKVGVELSQQYFHFPEHNSLPVLLIAQANTFIIQTQVVILKCHTSITCAYLRNTNYVRDTVCFPGLCCMIGQLPRHGGEVEGNFEPKWLALRMQSHCMPHALLESKHGRVLCTLPIQTSRAAKRICAIL